MLPALRGVACLEPRLQRCENGIGAHVVPLFIDEEPRQSRCQLTLNSLVGSLFQELSHLTHQDLSQLTYRDQGESQDRDLGQRLGLIVQVF